MKQHNNPEKSQSAQRILDYNDYPIDDALRRVAVRRSDGSFEHGWFEAGKGERTNADGLVEKFFRVRKFEQHGDELRQLEKDVSLSRLEAWQEEYDRQRKLGQRAVGKAVADALPVEPQEVVDPYAARIRELAKFPEPKGRDRFGNNLDGRRQVTEQSAADAALAIRFVDEDIKDLFFRHRTDDLWREEDMAELLRTDETLRVELFKLLDEKIKKTHYLPRRIYTNSQKNINYPGYPRDLSSQEAAVLLGIAMLDGTFKRTSDPIEVVHGDVIIGQHRAAAIKVMGLRGKPYVNEVHRVEG